MSLIYVASSWRNKVQPLVVDALSAFGHKVYDFRHPYDGNNGFSWSEIDTKWQQWTREEFRAGLEHPRAKQGFSLDMASLALCDACVLVLPSGRSAHLEAGFAIGAGKPTAILLSTGEPELMYLMSAALCTSIEEILAWSRTL